MINIDRYAYVSKLKNMDPAKKVLFALLTLGVCIWADSILISVAVLLFMCYLTVARGRIPFTVFGKLMLVPIAFLTVSVITVALNTSDNNSGFLFSLPIADLYVGVSQGGVQLAALLFFKSLGAVSCLYFLSLNTPMVLLLALLRRIKAPKLFVELMGLVYRFIFVLLETAEIMITAQNSRLGYASLSSGYRSLGALASTLFIRAYKRSEELYTSLEARGYDGELNVLEEPFVTRWSEYIAPVVLNLLLIFCTMLLRRFSGGMPL